jgi:predicted DCC family thiol-disulfide oxidoreductase YuxK
VINIILFDGVCVMCSTLADFVIARDPTARFMFSSLQSDTGRQLATKHGIPAGELDTMVLIESGIAYTKSEAALRVARRLPALWPLLWCFMVVPSPLRDAIYDWFGRKRYDWFGQTHVCRAPTAEDRDRFLQ